MNNQPQHLGYEEPPTVTYSPGDLGGVPAAFVDAELRAQQYAGLYGPAYREEAFNVLPLISAIFLGLMGILPLMGLTYACVLLVQAGGWYGAGFAVIFFVPIISTLIRVVFYRVPITAMIIHRGRGYMWASRLAWTDTYRRRWMSDAQWWHHHRC